MFCMCKARRNNPKFPKHMLVQWEYLEEEEKSLL